MTSNNLEAIELLIEAYGRMDLLRYESKLVKKALALLQADEVHEVTCIGDKCAFYGKQHRRCHIDVRRQKPTKETKLKAIKERLQLMDSPRPEVLYLRDEVVRIANVLLEEEY